MVDSIPVLGPDNNVLSYTHPARARKLVKNGNAVVVGTRPFIVRLKRDPREDKMTKPAIITNFTEYFKTERDVYVLNKSNTQVSLQFETFPGRIEGVLLPKAKKPINLTQLVPFSAIKGSLDIRKMVNRRPPALVLLSEAEYLAYYDKLAEKRGTSRADEIDDAAQYQSDLQGKRTFTNPTPKGRTTIEEEADERKNKPLEPDEKVTARVVGLCANVGDDIDEKDRMGAREMLEELRDMELTSADLEYLLGHGYYKSVKNFAQKEMDENYPGVEDVASSEI